METWDEIGVLDLEIYTLQSCEPCEILKAIVAQGSLDAYCRVRFVAMNALSARELRLKTGEALAYPFLIVKEDGEFRGWRKGVSSADHEIELQSLLGWIASVSGGTDAG
jgi:hypothetical protein